MSGSALREFVHGLSVAEAHAIAYGTAHGVGTVAAYALGFNGVAIGLVVLAFVLNGWLRLKATEGFPVVRNIYRAIPDRILSQIRNELHYYDIPFVLAAAMSYAIGHYAGLL